MKDQQHGFRPCIIVQNNDNNIHSNTTIVCPITKAVKSYNKTRSRKLNLTVMCCEQIRVIDKKKLARYLLTVSADTMAEIESKIKNCIRECRGGKSNVYLGSI